MRGPRTQQRKGSISIVDGSDDYAVRSLKVAKHDTELLQVRRMYVECKSVNIDEAAMVY